MYLSFSSGCQGPHRYHHHSHPPPRHPGPRGQGRAGIGASSWSRWTRPHSASRADSPSHQRTSDTQGEGKIQKKTSTATMS